LVLIALVINVVNVAAVPPGIRVFESWAMGIALTAVLAGAAYLALTFSGAAVHRHQKLAVGRLIAAQALTALFERGKLPSTEVGSLKAYGRTLLGMTIEDSEPPRAVLTRVASEVGLKVPETMDFSEVEEKQKDQ
jgi:hypothetical protein